MTTRAVLLVPEVATEEMLLAGAKVNNHRISAATFDAMLAAVPDKYRRLREAEVRVIDGAKLLRDVEFKEAVASRHDRLHEMARYGLQVMEAKRALDAYIAALLAAEKEVEG